MAAALSIEDMSWGPTRDRLLISHVRFDVRPGTITTIVGPNGAGKSTLLRCIYRFHRPLSGKVLLDGHDIAGLKQRELARRVAAVLQEHGSEFPFTVRQIVELGRMPHHTFGFRRDRAGTDIVDEALSRLELDDLADAPFQQLSGGEKQRVLLARVLAQQPDLIVLDEPTNHLDIRHQLELLAILRSLGQTIVMTMHDLGMAADIANQVVVLRKGEMLACGQPAETLTTDVIRAAFDVDTQMIPHATDRNGPSALHFSFSLPDVSRKA